MGAARTFAARLLRAMLRHAPEERRAWAEAMLGELDYVEGEWAALFWALGCTTVMFRAWLSAWCDWMRERLATFLGLKKEREGTKVNSTGKKTLGVLSGIGIALALGVGAFFLSPTIARLLQSVGVPRTIWTHLLTILVPTELILVAGAIWLWRNRRAPVAVGLLATGLVMAGHIVVFLIQR
jgi:hypothetical protein